jgi:nitrate reductase assembly molybdenum cofactor insertion protein NarJ
MATTSIEGLERRAVAFCLAARLTAWPDDALAPEAGMLAQGLDDGDALERRLAELAGTVSREQLESAYIALFENGPGRCPIHETEYGRMRGLSKGNELADLEGFYLAFGLGRSEGSHAKVMGDHLAVELEFYGTLLAKHAAQLEREDAEGRFVVEQARRTFLADHLGRIAPAVASQPVVAEHALYGPLFDAVRALVLDECKRLAVAPAPLDFQESGSNAEPEGLCCGDTVSPAPAPVLGGRPTMPPS